MDFSDLPVMQMMSGKMSWLSRRTDVLAENVANVDMPDYRARDLKAVSFRELVRGEQVSAGNAPKQTHAAHMTGTLPVSVFKDEARPDEFEAALDGNDVGVEQQMVKLNETQMSYQMTLNLYKKHIDMIRTALGRRG
jgi:flagellar basal-body rod protein FlgB